MSDPYTVVQTLEFPYRRSLGSVMGAASLALRDRRILGARTRTGQVLVPPLEYDPHTSDPIDDLVEVGPGGEVVTWTWVSNPSSRHPLATPFAFALIKLDGADTALVHAVEAADSSAMRTGMRVTPRWTDEPTGVITDIVAFVAEGGAS